MNRLKSLVVLAFLLNACQQPAASDNSATSLEDKRALLVEKRNTLQSLTSEIENLEAEIAELDPAATATKKLVTTIAVEKTDFQRYAEIQGTVEADETAAASAEVPGRLLSVTVKEGDRVRKGQLIATLDMDQVNKQLAEIDKSLELAEDVFARQDRLWKQNIGSELQYLEAKNSVERLRKSRETVEYQLTKAKVYAPISGVVDRVGMEAGELAMTGAPIIEILSLNRLKVVADLPENFLQNVRRGDQVSITYPALDMEQNGRVNLIGSTINPANRTFKVEVNTGNPGGQLKPNLLAIVKVQDYAEKDVVIIPIDLVQEEVGGKKYVMVTNNQDADLLAKKVYITTGESYKGQVIVTTGLQGNETLIDRGSRGLADQEPIEIFNEQNAANNG